MARETKNRPPAKPAASGRSGSSDNAASAPARKKPFNPLRFFSEVRQEGRKVTWTGRRETLISTIMVVIMSIIAMIFFFAVDTVLGWIVNALLSLGG
ncbi:preprotein translocase subunit SecE [Alkalicaulis satelles]|uniref:Protein translocase subunit SecE n=1 Tax=Alkalicaulis satelles TaxID=2609175 RepID=A0A5M6ZDD0_9PROT|nr:preprotein translocase subunit SecE [Alkalicaulis satelles]KAA5801088.1 preprotein translocase subunit SecE [Alkalicaulis satelles]